ncbi:MAG TPA: hypothetical protein VHH11_12085 [Gammaproteobacteria bacterium]|nr:hypothetical protein [Gammaproteobacteria bacterium]
MKKSSSFGTGTVTLLIGLAPALIGPIALAEGFADIAKPIAVEIDKTVMRIDLAAALRAVRENLAGARVVAPEAGAAQEDVQLAVVESHDRG